jgi:hypothetical protein
METSFTAFRSVRFVQNWRWLLWAIAFVTRCPFLFDSPILSKWMVASTPVAFSDFVLVSDVTMRLENVIAYRMRPRHLQYGRRRIVRGTVWIAP